VTSKTRVLVISHGHPSFSLGGAEVASYNLHLGLSDLPGWESHYLARVAPPVSRHAGSHLLSLRQKPREILFHADDYDHVRGSNRNLAALETDFVRYLKDLRPDVVHFHHFLGLGIETVLAVRHALPGVPVVFTFHEYLAICHHHGQMVKTQRNALCYRASPADCAGCFPQMGEAQLYRREQFLKTFLELCDAYVSPSHFLIDRYVDWGLPRAKFRMIENGLTVEEIAPPRPIPRGGRRNRFAFFGQLTEFKGAHVLVEAASRIPQKVWGDDSALMIFGGNLERQPPAYQKHFTEQVQRAGRRVRFYGSYRAAELPGLMKDVDWVVLPSIWWENSPVVIQEAFLHGRPVIASNIGGMAEKVQHGVNGLNFRNASVEDLVDRLIETLTSPDLWDRLRMRIRRPIDRTECAERHVAVYEDLLGRSRGAAEAAPERAVARPS
jgi:glycosyltransferase involved in cell wall biosynthesis